MKFAAALLALVSFVNAASLVDTLLANNENLLLKVASTVPAVYQALSVFEGTLFAPTDAALLTAVTAGFNVSDTAKLAKVLTYHAVPTVQYDPTKFGPLTFLSTLEGNKVKALKGKTDVTIESAFGAPAANVIKSVTFDKGIIHIIDSVLAVPANIVEVAKLAKLNQLLAAVGFAGLADTVAGLKDVNILAPTDGAFAKISEVAATLTPAQIQTILLLHVIPKVVTSVHIQEAEFIGQVETLSGKNTLDFDFNGRAVQITGPNGKSRASVVAADVLANGVIVHVIDSVLLPPFPAVEPPSSSSSATSTSSDAASSTPSSAPASSTSSSVVIPTASSAATPATSANAGSSTESASVALVEPTTKSAYIAPSPAYSVPAPKVSQTNIYKSGVEGLVASAAALVAAAALS
ncbi:Stabilin-2 [Chytriomyces hyalinus]|nr:Stabilin-2 [Chytriomyces hyalinus]